jgi:hypothetical protein
MYEIIVILKALTEIAGVAFLGQGVLWVIAGAKRNENIVYNLFKTLTSPVTRVTRVITPRIIIDAHIGLVAFFLLMLLWVALTALKIKLVLDHAAGGG